MASLFTVTLASDRNHFIAATLLWTHTLSHIPAVNVLAKLGFIAGKIFLPFSAWFPQEVVSLPI